VDVDAVEERAADPLLVAGDRRRGAAALLDRVAEIAARAPVQIAIAVPS
jgi:hypothetical protein